MFVYLLRHANGKQFKIGKTIDLPQRISALGGYRQFDIDGSRCIKVASSKEASRLEKILHRAFVQWNIAVDENARYIGDTEQFAIDCFERVHQFLAENADLIGGAKPQQLPIAPAILAAADERQRRLDATRLERAKNSIERMYRQNAATLQALEKFLGSRASGDISAGIWAPDEEPSHAYLMYAGKDRSILEDLHQANLIGLNMAASLFPTVIRSHDFAMITMERRLLNDGLKGRMWGSMNENSCPLPEMFSAINAQLDEIVERLCELPTVGDTGVFSIIEASQLVDTTTPQTLEALRRKIRDVVLTLYQQPSWFAPDSLDDLTAIDPWLLRYWKSKLSELGLSEDDVWLIQNEETIAAQKDFQVKIFQKCDKLFEREAVSWLRTPHSMLNNLEPWMIMDSDKGKIAIWNTLIEIESFLSMSE